MSARWMSTRTRSRPPSGLACELMRLICPPYPMTNSRSVARKYWVQTTTWSHVAFRFPPCLLSSYPHQSGQLNDPRSCMPPQSQSCFLVASAFHPSHRAKITRIIMAWPRHVRDKGRRPRAKTRRKSQMSTTFPLSRALKMPLGDKYS